jgi:hypothetical protein
MARERDRRVAWRTPQSRRGSVSSRQETDHASARQAGGQATLAALGLEEFPLGGSELLVRQYAGVLELRELL